MKLAAWALKHSCASFDDIRAVFGPRWAYHHRDAILAMTDQPPGLAKVAAARDKAIHEKRYSKLKPTPVRRFSRTVKLSLTLLSLLSAFSSLFAGESGLIQTFQSLDGFEAGEPVVTAVTCYAHNTHVGWHQAIRYITARYVPPSFDDTPVGDINLASLSGLSVWAGDGDDGRITITLDFTNLKPTRGYTGSQIVAATLECLRRIAGDKLASTPIQTKYRPSRQEDIKHLVSTFLKHPKDKEFHLQ